MKKAPIPHYETNRLIDLQRLRILDTPKEEIFDNITQLAKNICHTPIALISLVDENRQWFKSCIGLPGVSETPRDISFCGHAILQTDIFEVPDARKHPDFFDNPLVQENVVCFYAGAPLCTKNGLRIGTLCVIDQHPRQLDAFQKESLQSLAKQIITLFELKIEQNESNRMREQLEDAQSMAKIGSWHFDLITKEQYWSKEHYAIFEIEAPQPQEILHQLYREKIHPDDLHELDRLVQNALIKGEGFVYNHRVYLDHGRRIKFVQGIGKVHSDQKGKPLAISGTCRDLTQEKESEMQFQAILESMTEGVLVQNTAGQIVQWNAAAISILNIKGNKITEHPFSQGTLIVDTRGLTIPIDQRPHFLAQAHQQKTSSLTVGLPNFGDQNIFKWLKIATNFIKKGNEEFVIITMIDITKEVDSTKEIQQIFELSNNLICIAGTDGMFKRINPQFEKILGIRSSEILKTPFIDFVHPDDRKDTLKEVEKLSNGFITVNFENRYLTRHNGYKVIRWNTSPDEKQGLLYAIGTDVTEIKLKEKIRLNVSLLREIYIKYAETPQVFWDKALKIILELTESEYGFLGEIKTTIDGTPYLKTFALTNISWNEQTSKMYEDLSNTGFEFYNLNSLFGYVIKNKTPMITNNPKENPHAHGLPSGHPPLNSFLGVPLFYAENMIGMVGMANRQEGFNQDFYNMLSEFFSAVGEIVNAFVLRRNMREAEKLSNFYKKAIEESSIVEMTDRTGKITFANDLFCQISGYKKEELLGQDHRLLNSGKMDKIFFKKMWDTIFSGNIWSGEICNKRKDGSLYWVHTIIIPSICSDGTVDKFLSIRRDITKEKEQNIELGIALEKAEQAAVAKSNFLSTMSHEIRTPLNGIIGLTKIINESELSENNKELVQTIHQSGQNLLALINDILDFSKIEAGKVELENVEVHLVQFISEFIRPFKISAKQKNLEFDFKITGNVNHYLLCDIGRIGQILANLFSNAIKFTIKGGVALEIEFLNSIKDQKFPAEQLVIFKVIDTGIGIPKESINKIFEAFTQGEQSTNRRFGGTGLGLSITKKLVDLMGGTIEVGGEVNCGTTFIVSLRLKKGQIINVTEVQKLKVEKGEDVSTNKMFAAHTQLTGRILVAEDNATNQIVIKRMLELIGPKYHFVSNGLEVLQTLKGTTEFDLILMDCQMPEMDGYEATKKIRSTIAAFNKIPIIALTANALPGDKERCLECGMNDYLSKPIEINRLRELLNQYLHSTNNIIDQNTLNQFQELEIGSGNDFLISMICSFKEASLKSLNNIDRNFANKDLISLSREAHSLKSSARSLGALPLGQLCQDLEQWGKNNNYDLIEQNLQIFKNIFYDTHEELEKLRLKIIATNEKTNKKGVA